MGRNVTRDATRARRREEWRAAHPPVAWGPFEVEAGGWWTANGHLFDANNEADKDFVEAQPKNLIWTVAEDDHGRDVFTTASRGGIPRLTSS